MSFHGSPIITLRNVVERAARPKQRPLITRKRFRTPESKAAYDAVCEFNKAHGIAPSPTLLGRDRKFFPTKRKVKVTLPVITAFDPK